MTTNFAFLQSIIVISYHTTGENLPHKNKTKRKFSFEFCLIATLGPLRCVGPVLPRAGLSTTPRRILQHGTWITVQASFSLKNCENEYFVPLKITDTLLLIFMLKLGYLLDISKDNKRFELPISCLLDRRFNQLSHGALMF
jgi:hypothetical protein